MYPIKKLISSVMLNAAQRIQLSRVWDLEPLIYQPITNVIESTNKSKPLETRINFELILWLVYFPLKLFILFSFILQKN